MSLYPQLTDTYYVDNDHNILKLMDYTYAKNITINQSFWSEADIDTRFKAGDQTLWNDIYGNLPAFRRRQFNFNRIRRVVNMPAGYQRQHRKSTIVTPVLPHAQQGADDFTKLLYYANNNASIDFTLSDAFEGALTTGMNMLSVWMDFRNDPVNGEIKVDNVSYNGYLIDPYFKNMDMSDCNNIWTRKYLTQKTVAGLLPGREDEIKSIKGYASRDGKFQFQPEAYNYGQQDLLIYDEFWYLDSRKQTLIVDVTTGECMEWQGHDDDLETFLKTYPQLTTISQEIPTTKLAVVVQGKVMYHGPNPLGIDRYPFVPVWAYYEPQMPYFPWRVQGIVRGVRDAQALYNRRRMIELDILESQVNSGFKYKENALVNPKDVFLQGQGKGLALKAEAQMTDVEKIMPADVPPSMIQLSELLGQEISQISGVNEELLGSAEDDKAGILSMMRQGAGLTTLQGLFDNLDRSQKLLGLMCIELMQAHWTPGKVERILGRAPADEFYNRAFAKYDVIVEEAPLTSTQKQLALRQALYLKEIGIPIPSSYLLDNMQIPDKDDLIKQIDAQEQAQQQQQQQMAQLQMQQLQVDNETKLAYADSQKALASERMNKVRLDAALSAERMQRADEDRTNAVLNLVKAAREIQGMDLAQLEQAIGIVKSLEGEEMAPTNTNQTKQTPV
ncbi:MAG: hypothetical protein LLG04_19005 [Parachlamydia sp.]|nr:hypothetical protein [Parachlamydia sp.]